MKSIVLKFGLLLCLAQSSFAFTLDWNQVDWATNGGSPNTSQIFTDVGGSGINIQMTLSISSGEWVSLDDNNRYDGNDGLYNGDESLQLYADFLNNDYSNSYVMVEFRFLNEYNSTTTVDNLSFDLFDIDHGKSGKNGYSYEDVIWGIAGDATWTSDDYTVTTGSKVSQESAPYHSNQSMYRGTYQDGTEEDGKGPTQDNSRSSMNVSWNAPVSYAKFYYSTGSNAAYDSSNPHEIGPVAQSIALGNISFGETQPVPEAGTVFTGILLLIGALLMGTKKSGLIDSLKRKTSFNQSEA